MIPDFKPLVILAYIGLLAVLVGVFAVIGGLTAWLLT